MHTTRHVVLGPVEPLTEREMEVLRLVAAGQANREIADELVVVLDTVKKHVRNILRKLDACNRTHSVARARELGLLRTDPPPREWPLSKSWA